MLSLAFFVSLQQILEDMALNLNKNLKLYYTIGEVAQMFGLNESTLRYWEQEFPSLRPKVSGPAKIRQYQEKDIEEIRVIHNLVKVRGFKLAAAKKMLNQPVEGEDAVLAGDGYDVVSDADGTELKQGYES